MVAADLRQRGLEGGRVVLALDPGLDYVAALFGILLAGATAVPSFPPTGKRALPRFVSIYRDCTPDLIVADPRYDQAGGKVEAELQAAAPDRSPRWLFIDDHLLTPSAAAADLRPPDRPSARAALLQYTSGSTGDPKGVVVTHDNLVSNSVTLDRNMGHEADRVGCSWLPPYHDMGLIGTIVLAVHSGWPLVMLSPMHFVQRPYRWLKAITDHRVTISVAPNFALDISATVVTDEELATLDLSTLRQLYCGAEPVLGATLDRFRDRFAPAGYAESAIVPCYGMAEATLFVSGKPAGTTFTRATIDRQALERGSVVAVEASSAEATEVVSCGVVADGHEILVVDPETRRPVPAGGVGEVWVSGPNVTAGYLGKPDQTAHTFRARPGAAGAGSPSHGSDGSGGATGDGDGGPAYLRTGDLGFVLDGELYITGRIKDLIIIAGRNLLPHDIELTVHGASPAVRNAAALPVDGERGERGEQLVIVVEVHRGTTPSPADVDQLREAVVAAVTREHAVTPIDVYVGPAGTVRTTTSGKVQRNPTKQAYLTGTLRRLASAQRPASPVPAASPESPG